jgi:hypothetical protein
VLTLLNSTRALVTIAVLAVCSTPALAQTYSSPKSKIDIHAFGIFDVNSIAATKSFEAVLGTSQLTAAGAGAEVGGWWKGLFLRIAVTRMEKTGSRVFVDGGTVFDLGIPLTVTMTPIEAGFGWRFGSNSRFEPYAGLSYVSLGYHEVSDFADVGDNVDESYKGSAVFGGVHVKIYKWIVAGGEAQYRHIQAPAASSGVSQAFDERNLGGATGRITIGVRF